ncbi:hypothetical protein J6TS2_31930 [Heyndrickxia sporothermodurans]|nr:hypothetical protein J6TS2_31930 [Heyndrickxia sporothermodurans]
MKNITYIQNLNEWRNEFAFFHSVKVRFSETDMFGHLNNTVPFTYFEEARIEYLKQKEMMQDWDKSSMKTIPVVADLQCDYIRQVYFDEKLKIFVKSNSVGTSSVDLHYMAINEKDELSFVGRGTVVQICPNTGKSIPWSDEEKRKLFTKISF